MSSVVLEIPDEAAMVLGAQPDGCAGQVLMAAAVKLYELGRISSGAAARLAGLPKPLFLTKLADYGVDTFGLSEGDLRAERPLA